MEQEEGGVQIRAAACLEEHVFCTAESDALCPELLRLLRLLNRLSIGEHLHALVLTATTTKQS